MLHAEAIYKIAIKLEPQRYEAFNNLGTLYFHQKKVKLALENYQIALKLFNQNTASTDSLEERIEKILKRNMFICYSSLNDKENAKKFSQTKLISKNLKFVYFVTTSSYKFEDIKKLIGRENCWKVKQASIEIGDPHLDSILDIAKNKIEEAYRVIQFNCLIETTYIRVYDDYESPPIIELTGNKFREFGNFFF